MVINKSTLGENADSLSKPSLFLPDLSINLEEYKKEARTDNVLTVAIKQYLKKSLISVIVFKELENKKDVGEEEIKNTVSQKIDNPASPINKIYEELCRTASTSITAYMKTMNTVVQSSDSFILSLSLERIPSPGRYKLRVIAGESITDKPGLDGSFFRNVAARVNELSIHGFGFDPFRKEKDLYRKPNTIEDTDVGIVIYNISSSLDRQDLREKLKEKLKFLIEEQSIIYMVDTVIDDINKLLLKKITEKNKEDVIVEIQLPQVGNFPFDYQAEKYHYIRYLVNGVDVTSEFLGDGATQYLKTGVYPNPLPDKKK